jgi:hypothetical protein
MEYSLDEVNAMFAPATKREWSLDEVQSMVPETEVAPEAAPPAPQKGFLQNVTETLGDAQEGLAQGISFNLADEAYGVVGTPFRMAANAISGADAGKGFGQRVSDAYARSRDFAREGYKQARERSPIATTVGEVGGGMALGGTAQRGGLSLLNAAKPTYGSMIGRGAAEGAAYGGAYGFGAGEGGIENRVDSAASGAALGAVTGGATGAIGAKMAKNAAVKSIPSSKALKQAGSAAYKEAEAAGLKVTDSAFDNVVDDIYKSSSKLGLDKGLTPDSWAALDRLNAVKGSPKTLEELSTLREVASGARDAVKPKDQMIARGIVEKIDNFVDNLKPADVMAGDAIKGASALNKARDLWKRGSKGQEIDTLIELAKSRAGQFSGSGFENALRTEFRALDRELIKYGNKGFTKAEVDAIRKVGRGGPVENALRYFGKLAPTGVVSAGSGAGLGYMLGGPVGAVAVPLAAIPARLGARAMTSANADYATALIRAGGKIPAVQQLPAQQRALLQSLLMGGSQQGRNVLPTETGILSTFE